jgi:hypothetical protein
MRGTHKLSSCGSTVRCRAMMCFLFLQKNHNIPKRSYLLGHAIPIVGAAGDCAGCAKLNICRSTSMDYLYSYCCRLYSIEHEMAVKPVDFFIRRTGALFFDIAFVQRWKEAAITPV